MNSKYCWGLIVFVAVVFSQRAFAQINVNREGSSLRVEFNSNTSGLWFLRTADGSDCEQGKVMVGNNTLDFVKIASPTDVVLEVTDPNRITISQTPINGEVRLSELSKPRGNASIYQLPVRT